MVIPLAVDAIIITGDINGDGLDDIVKIKMQPDAKMSLLKKNIFFYL